MFRLSQLVEVDCPGDHLLYFRFFGRVLGRGLFDRQLVRCHFVQSMYKHLLGWPVTFKDLKDQDEIYYESLMKLVSMEDIASLGLDFSVTENIGETPTTFELVPDGYQKNVSEENLPEFIDAVLRYRLLGRTSAQMTELMLGFFDVIPEQALVVFDSKELELVLCGLPTIEIDDWMTHTRYTGTLKDVGLDDSVVKWFWEIVKDFDQEMKARLLQFCTGSKSCPAQGFSALQGMDGNVKLFVIHGTDAGPESYPKAQ